MYEALRHGRRIKLPQVGIFADGVAVRQAGKEPFRIARQYVDEVMTVTTDEICAAMKDVFDDCRSVLEPAGALAIAGIKKYVEATGIRDSSLVAINSGSNINFDRLRHVAERAQIGEQREALLAVTIPEEPGSFRRFCRTIGKRGITEFNYRYADARQAHVFAGVQLQDGEDERHALVEELRGHGYPVEDLTDSEIAKLHVRHMVGGRVPGLKNELLFRFQFPERPGALLAIPVLDGHALEHQPVPLSQSRGGLRPRPGGHPGAAGKPQGVPGGTRKTRLCLPGRDELPGL